MSLLTASGSTDTPSPTQPVVSDEEDYKIAPVKMNLLPDEATVKNTLNVFMHVGRVGAENGLGWAINCHRRYGKDCSVPRAVNTRSRISTVLYNVLFVWKGLGHPDHLSHRLITWLRLLL